MGFTTFSKWVAKALLDNGLLACFDTNYRYFDRPSRRKRKIGRQWHGALRDDSFISSPASFTARVKGGGHAWLP
jgi:hypothetical protein